MLKFWLNSSFLLEALGIIMDQLTKYQTRQIRNAIYSVVDTSSKRRTKLVESGEIQTAESLTITESENMLQNLADEFNQVLLDKIVEDIQAPGQKILMATGKLNISINKLTSINQFIGFLGKIIDGIMMVISAVQSGSPLKLAGLLDIIENLSA
jgi:hypothetical protein